MISDVVREEEEGFVLPRAGFVCSGLEGGVLLLDGAAHVDLILHNDDFTGVARVRMVDNQGPGRVLVVSPAAGGEPAIWDATSKRQTIRPGELLPAELTEMIESFGMPMPGEQPKGEDE